MVNPSHWLGRRPAGAAHCSAGEPLGARALGASQRRCVGPANLVQQGLLQRGTRRIGRSTVRRTTTRYLPQQTPGNVIERLGLPF